MASFSRMYSGNFSNTIVGRPVWCEQFGKKYDLRRQKDRDAHFTKLLTQGLYQFPDYRDNTNIRSCVFNCRCLDYLSRHRTLEQELLKAEKSSNSRKSYFLVIEISSVLRYNRLILRFIFKSMHIGLWKALLSAQIAMLRSRQVDNYDRGNALQFSIVLSMLHWNAKHLTFARDRGLFKIVANQFIHDYFLGKEDKGKASSILTIGSHLSQKYDIQNVVPDIWVFKLEAYQNNPRGRPLFLQLTSTVNSMCCWAPCSQPHRKMYICKRCRLVQYCCRRHQKKHWKFIHRQQCRNY